MAHATITLSPTEKIQRPSNEDLSHSSFVPLSEDSFDASGLTAWRILRQRIHDLQTQVAGKDADLAALRLQNAIQQDRAQGWRNHSAVLGNLLDGVTHSWIWRLAAPLRWLKNLLKRRRLSQINLIPVQDLQCVPGAPLGTWKATGHDPQFLLPCLWPAGWVRIRLKLVSLQPGRVQFFIDSGQGINRREMIEKPNRSGVVDLDWLEYFPRGIRMLRLDPLDTPGQIVLQSFQIESVAALRGWWGKLRLSLSKMVKCNNLSNALASVISRLFGGRLGKNRALRHMTQKSPILGPANADTDSDYQAWRQARQLTEDDRERMKADILDVGDPPLLSVLLPISTDDIADVRRAVESVRRQTYVHWELCLAVDQTANAKARSLAEDLALSDARIQIVAPPEAANVGEALDAALSLVRGSFFALLRPKDRLAEHALYRVAKTLFADPSLDLLYSDEDHVDEAGNHCRPFFKPDWSPEYLLGWHYTGNLTVYRTRTAMELGGFDGDFLYRSTYDLTLRFSAHTKQIGHIADVLYHQGDNQASCKRESLEQAVFWEEQRAIGKFLQQTGRAATLEPGIREGLHRVRHVVQGTPKVSIIIASACHWVHLPGLDNYFVAACVRSIRAKSTYGNYEIILVHNNAVPGDLKSQLDDWQVRTLAYTGPFNWSAAMNRGATMADGQQLLFLNDDMEVVSPDWLETMLEYGQQPEIGVVGGKLNFPGGRIQHLGVNILNGTPGHPLFGFPEDHPGYFGSAVTPRNYSAVTGACLMTRKSLFHALGGFDEQFPLNYNDIDFCLRVAQAGKRIVFTPYAQMLHYESVTKEGTFSVELQAFQKRWGFRWAKDPYYNPNLSMTELDYRIDA